MKNLSRSKIVYPADEYFGDCKIFLNPDYGKPFRSHYVFKHKGLPHSVIVKNGRKILLPEGVPKNTPMLKTVLRKIKEEYNIEW